MHSQAWSSENLTFSVDCRNRHRDYRQSVTRSDVHEVPAAVAGVSIGDRIRLARERAGLSKSELGRAVGSSYRLVHRWEIDEQAPSADYLRRIAGALHVTIEELLGVAAGQDPPFKAWHVFLETPEGVGLSADERRALQSIAWPSGVEPTVIAYAMMLSAIRLAS